MGTKNDIIGLGVAPEVAAKVDTLDITSVVTSSLTTSVLAGSASATVSAAGTDLAGATALTAVVNNVTTAAASSGVKLPAFAIGGICLVRNSGANALTVYPDTASIKINGGTDGAGVSVATTEVAVFAKVSATNWIGGVAVVF